MGKKLTVGQLGSLSPSSQERVGEPLRGTVPPRLGGRDGRGCRGSPGNQTNKQAYSPRPQSRHPRGYKALANVSGSQQKIRKTHKEIYWKTERTQMSGFTKASK